MFLSGIQVYFKFFSIFWMYLPLSWTGADVNIKLWPYQQNPYSRWNAHLLGSPQSPEEVWAVMGDEQECVYCLIRQARKSPPFNTELAGSSNEMQDPSPEALH